jgi:flagellar export protein FliJ
VAERQEYRLATLVRLRERKKEQAEIYVAECLKALRIEEERLREMEKELERMVAKRLAKTREYSERAMRGEMDASGVTSANVFLKRLKDIEENHKTAVEGQKAVLAEKQEDVDSARRDLVTATGELKALEKHREKWEEEIHRQELAKQEEQMDEIAQTIFLKRDN